MVVNINSTPPGVNVVEQMRASNAIIGGEGNGGADLPHVACRSRCLGWDWSVSDAPGHEKFDMQ